MNSVQQRIYNQVVKPAMDNIAGIGMGTVLESDARTQTAIIKMTDDKGEREERILPRAPMMTIGGMKQSAPLPGDNVLVAFLSSSYRHPVILGKIDIEHGIHTRNQKESHFRSGSNITDYYNDREGEDWSVE